MGIKCVVKWLRFQGIKEIAVLIITFVACDRLGHNINILLLQVLKIAIWEKLAIRNF